MAQVLSVLAFSTKVIKERAISGSMASIHTSLADYDAEKFLKKTIRRTEVDDALQRLNMLTNEAGLTTAARTLELASNIDGNVTEMKAVLDTVAVDAKEKARGIKKDVEVARRGA